MMWPLFGKVKVSSQSSPEALFQRAKCSSYSPSYLAWVGWVISLLFLQHKLSESCGGELASPPSLPWDSETGFWAFFFFFFFFSSLLFSFFHKRPETWQMFSATVFLAELYLYDSVSGHHGCFCFFVRLNWTAIHKELASRLPVLYFNPSEPQPFSRHFMLLSRLKFWYFQFILLIIPLYFYLKGDILCIYI